MAFLSKMENVAAMVASEKTKDEIIGVRNEPPEQLIILAINRSMNSVWLKSATVHVRMKINRNK